MRGAVLWIAMMSAAPAGCAAALAQNAAPPPAEAALPPVPPATGVAAPQPGPIATLQQQLRDAGYAAGPVNGVMTDKTRQALAAYRQRTGRLPQALPSETADPVRRVQAGLQRLGLFAGPIDGGVGPQTRDAIIRFEASRGLAIDPRVSDDLLAALDAASTAAVPGTSPASQAAMPPTEPSAAPEMLGRQPLPLWINPPPIR